MFDLIDQYKAKIDDLRPFQGDMLRQIKEYYKIGLTWSSNAIEGNTLTESETKVILEDGLTIGGKPLKDFYETVGHGKAYDFMFSMLDSKEITQEQIKEMHRLFYTGINEEMAGVYRVESVVITGSHYPVSKPEEIQQDMDALIKWIVNQRADYHPVEFAAMLHKRFVFIHPFIDGNGRVARLLMNAALIQNGYLLAVIPPILRHEYIALLEKAHTDEQPFIQFIADRVLESEKEIMRLLKIPK